jgi:hypothetical protein
MRVLEREFYRSARGPAPGDYDAWCLIFDNDTARIVVRHEWQNARHGGVDEFEIADFLKQQNAARDALLALLFDQISTDIRSVYESTP